MKINFLSLFILVLFVNWVQKYDNAKDALKDYPAQDRRNGKQPKYIYFTLRKEKAKELDYFSKILYRLMATASVRPYFVNLEDSQLLGIVPKDAEIDKEVILETFKDVIEAIEIKDTIQ